MSALARYYHSTGCQVLGYDRTLGPVALQLQKEGIWVTTEVEGLWESGRLQGPDRVRVVYTAAIPERSPVLERFERLGYPIRKRALELADIVRGRRSMAIAGTHGKTTTASILTHILLESGHPVTAFLGGISEDFGSNFIHRGEGDTPERIFVVEADEFDRSFLHLHPWSACITSLDPDHLDIYGTHENLVEAYLQFAAQVVRPEGVYAPRRLSLGGSTLALEEQADYSFRDIEVRDGWYTFDFHYPDGKVEGVMTSLPGRHNLMNALCALALAVQAVPYDAARYLEGCRGVHRRFNTLYRSDSLVVVDDYAHHPTEIDAVYDALRELYPGKKLHALFQPHLYSRTRDFGPAFARSLSRFDSVRLMEIYPAREEPLPGIDSSWLLSQIPSYDKAMILSHELAEWVGGMQDCVLAAMGAGDIGEDIRELITKMNPKS